MPRTSLIALATALAAWSCGGSAPSRSAPAPAPATRTLLGGATELVVVTTPGWDSTAGTLRRFSRDRASAAWRPAGAPVPVVVGRSGLGWAADAGAAASNGDPRKREGDGRSPAGVFPLDTAFGYAPADSMQWVRLPYVPLDVGTECVDDTGSVHYNTVVDRAAVPAVDWSSSERMRSVREYRYGVIVGYNATPPVRGRGSCIFLHVWDGPGSHTSGCTAFDADRLTEVIAWLDPRRHPVMVQLPAAEYARLRAAWSLPALGD
jgi:D-alanyl-D-alanine dipeptidase